jgi:hypothetical protein
LVGEIVDAEDGFGLAQRGGVVFEAKEGERERGVHIVGVDDIPVAAEGKCAKERTATEGRPADEAVSVIVRSAGGMVDAGAVEELGAIDE